MTQTVPTNREVGTPIHAPVAGKLRNRPGDARLT
jgi:hypothetical protein